MRLGKNQLIILFLFLFLVFQGKEIKAEGPTFTVCPSGTQGEGGCDYIGGEGIQQAVDAAETRNASHKTKIVIKAGNYTRQNFTEYVNSNNKKRKCFVNTREKFLIFEGEREVTFDGKNSANMSGICAKGGEIEVKNLKIIGFKEDSGECFENDTTQACSEGFGIILELTGRATIQESEVNENVIDGVRLFDSSRATIQDSKISGNHKGGVILVGSSQATMQKTQISGHNIGGIILFDSSRATIQNSEISRNHFSGIYLGDFSQATIQNSQISENQKYGINTNYGGYGIFLIGDSQANIQNNQINGNQLDGIYLVDFSQATIINNSLYKNKVAGINIYQCGDHNPSVTAKNNIITNTIKNDDGTFGFGIGGFCLHEQGKLNNDTFAYNLIWGNEGDNTGCGGEELCENFTGRINADPKFVNPEGGDFHLQPGSPAIDSGDPEIKDPDGSRSDMGVYGGPGVCSSDPNLPGCGAVPPSETPGSLPQFGSCGSCSADQWGGCTPPSECRLVNDINICQANNKPGAPCCLRDQSCASGYKPPCGYGDPRLYCHKCQRFQDSPPWCTSFQIDCGAGKPAKPRLKSPFGGSRVAEDNPLTLMWYAYGEGLPERCGEFLEDTWKKWEDCRGVVHWNSQAQCIPEVGNGENAGDRSCWGYVCPRGQFGIPSQWRFYQVLVKRPGEDDFQEVCNIEEIPNPSVVGGTIPSQKVSCEFTLQNPGFYSWKVKAGYAVPLGEGNVFINSNESEPSSFLFCPLGDRGNLNCDNQRAIDEADLSLILSTWGEIPDWSREVRWSPDLNGDNEVDQNDLQLLLENWRV